ncbi:inositol monophosphatase family protein [Ruegeria sp. HKCCA6837]|uniref:inositol monophosphatase family protein n=1 Tax=Ruegeria sp. HKCCA6837 TaxID=2682989 RepID=UPI0020C51AD8|nr:inositol monophosphatase family protein [Ruegeria sp. HKCCA6837]
MVVTHTLKEHSIQMTNIGSTNGMRFLRGSLGVELKLDERPVTQADKPVEAEVRSYLKRHFPEHGIFGEEHGQEAGDGRHMWFIDPVGGTRCLASCVHIRLRDSLG